MTNPKRETIYQILIKNTADINIMSERVDRHFPEQERKLDDLAKQLFGKIDQLKDMIHVVEINSVKEDGLIKTKLMMMVSGISVVVYLLGDAAKALIQSAIHASHSVKEVFSAAIQTFQK